MERYFTCLYFAARSLTGGEPRPAEIFLANLGLAGLAVNLGLAGLLELRHFPRSESGTSWSLDEIWD